MGSPHSQDSPPSSSSSCLSRYTHTCHLISRRKCPPQSWGTTHPVLSLECPLLPSFSLNILPTSSIRPSLPPKDMPTSSRRSSVSIFQGTLEHGSRFALCPVFVPHIAGEGRTLCQPPAPARWAPLGGGQREDIWRCRGARWKVAPPPPKALLDLVGEAHGEPQGSLPPWTAWDPLEPSVEEVGVRGEGRGRGHTRGHPCGCP